MTREMKRVVWEWLPGFVAGLIPLLMFLLASLGANAVTGAHGLDAAKDAAARALIIAQYDAEWWSVFCDRLGEHLIILGMVSSAVSVFTAFPRLFSQNHEDRPLGEGSLLLVMCVTLLLVFTVATYVMQQVHVTKMESLHSASFYSAAGLSFAAVLSSFYLEIAIANLRLQRSPSSATAAGVTTAPQL